MIHQSRWTARKIAKRLKLIEPFVYRQRESLGAFRYCALASPHAEPIIDPKFDDSAWEVIAPHTYWGTWDTDFMLRGSFTVPADWDLNQPIALYLPLGVSGDFSHPETLVYIDGQPIAACDRHHQEIRLPR